ncbi:MAG: response regulator [Oligoflexia bacterium]|nr:response regulator [Oligoflexia bacterium]
MRILVVEDEKSSSKLLGEVLKPYGTVVASDTSEDGFELFMTALEAGEPFDVICLDVGLPGLDGIELLDEIRNIEEEKGIIGEAGSKIFVISGACDLNTFADASEAGCTTFLCKPINTQKLLSELRRFKLVEK